jgi:hypothetical protein
LDSFVKSGNVSDAFKAAAVMANLPALVANLTLNISTWTLPKSFSYTPMPPTPAPSPLQGVAFNTSADSEPDRGKEEPMLSLRVIIILVGAMAAVGLMVAAFLSRQRQPPKLKIIPASWRLRLRRA